MTILDWLVIAFYMLGVISLGLWMGRKEEGMDDYFLGGRGIPWWAAALSLVATEISAATFLGAPEQGLTRDFTYLQFGVGSILARIVLAFLFIGIFYKMRVYTVYGFLSERFGSPTRTTAAGAFLLGRLFAGGSRIFIAALAVKVVTGFDMSLSIVVLGIIAIGYTLFGGIKAVIWTDVIQAIVLISGALMTIFALSADNPLSIGETWDFLAANDKLRLFSSEGSILSNSYHWFPAIIGGFFLTMATHGTDQSMIQRLLTCKDSYRGKLSMVLSGFWGIGVTILFLIAGQLLFVVYEHRTGSPEFLAAADTVMASGKAGDVYLHYILQGLPPGISGLLIAAVVAAAMSSIDSELNAMSSAAVNDFYKPFFKPNADEHQLLKVAKVFTVVAGFALIGLGVLVADFYYDNPDTDLLSIALGVMTLFYGGLLGVFLVGILTRNRGATTPNIIGMVGSTLLIILITYKAKLLPALGLVNADDPGSGLFAWLYNLQLGWPWFIIIGSTVTICISLLGVTAREIVERYEQGGYQERKR